MGRAHGADEQVVDVAWALPGPRGRVDGRVGEGRVEAVEVPVQAAELAGDDGAGAAGARGARVAEHDIALAVFEAEVVDGVFLFSGGLC